MAEKCVFWLDSHADSSILWGGIEDGIGRHRRQSLGAIGDHGWSL